MPDTLRPIAEAMARVRMVPDAPTSVPATTSSTLPSTRPDAATARPVKALSSEITIGTSAPPTGSTSSTPATRPSASSTTASHPAPVKTTETAAPIAASSTRPMIAGSPGNTTGRVVMSSCSFAKVTSEPENEIAPTSSVNTIATRTHGSSVWASSSRATSAAAPPPTPLKSATSCGIWVICTRRATGAAIAEPTAMAARIHGMFSSLDERNTVTTAMRAPAAPMRLPRRAVFGELRPFSARMKQTAATR